MKTDNNVARVGRLVGRVAGFLPAAHYAALGGVGAVVVLAPEASAAPVQSTVVDLVVPATVGGVYINVVTGVTNGTPGFVTGWDLDPWGAASLSWFDNGAFPSGNPSMMRYPGVIAGSAGSLDPGTVVDGTGSFGTGAVTFGAAAGNWNLNATNYFGFRFISEDTLLHYGWGTMIVGASALTRTVGVLWYEDQANTAITVAPAGEVPEPATGLLLASGVAGLLALRRRRRQAR